MLSSLNFNQAKPNAYYPYYQSAFTFLWGKLYRNSCTKSWQALALFLYDFFPGLHGQFISVTCGPDVTFRLVSCDTKKIDCGEILRSENWTPMTMTIMNVVWQNRVTGYWSVSEQRALTESRQNHFESSTSPPAPISESDISNFKCQMLRLRTVLGHSRNPGHRLPLTRSNIAKLGNGKKFSLELCHKSCLCIILKMKKRLNLQKQNSWYIYVTSQRFSKPLYITKPWKGSTFLTTISS